MKRLALLLPLLALAAAPARAEDPATNAAVVWVSRIPLDGSRPRYESASGLPGRYRLGTLDDGGTYSGVARLFFGSASAWSAIHEANRARFPDPARVPAEADLAVPAPAASIPPTAPGHRYRWTFGAQAGETDVGPDGLLTIPGLELSRERRCLVVRPL